ncbi:SPW repeat protein [Mesorhizobium sp. IMUNJ 23232]|uniref:SPW repeat protein n=1 Tax=Mesorhizobium sp. IMUNJ 23232 TaxID=3376064 RepID=UPI00379942B4
MANSLMEGRKAQDWINLALAVCLFVSPWFIGFVTDVRPAWNAWVVGVVLAGFTLAAISAFAEWEEWVNFLLGLWLVVSPWLLGFSANVNAMWTHVIMGVLIAAASAWAVWDFRHGPHAHA